MVGAAIHTCEGAIPARSLCPIPDSVLAGKGIFLTSPELTILQLASHTKSITETLAIIMELTGTYRLYNDSADYGCPALTSTAALRSFASKARGLHGRKALLKALPWAMDGSASPAETSLAISLALPWRLGGANLGIPLLNQPIELNREATRILRRESITPDILLRKGSHCVALEYDSDEFHGGIEQSTYDERRRNTYAAMGIPCIIVRPSNLKTDSAFSAIADAARKNLGLSLRHAPANYETVRHELLEETLAQWRKPRKSYTTYASYASDSYASGPYASDSLRPEGIPSWAMIPTPQVIPPEPIDDQWPPPPPDDSQWGVVDD